jgi:hypothetical protein
VQAEQCEAGSVKLVDDGVAVLLENAAVSFP